MCTYVNYQTIHKGATPLYVICQAARPSAPMIRRLLNAGDNLHTFDNAGRTPLEEMCVKCELDLIFEVIRFHNPLLAEVRSKNVFSAVFHHS